MTGFYVEPGASSAPNGCISYYFDAPYTGYYKVSDAPFSVKIVSRNKAGTFFLTVHHVARRTMHLRTPLANHHL